MGGCLFQALTHKDIRRHKLNKNQQYILCAIYASTIYYISQMRNVVVWDNVVHRPEYVVSCIQKVIRDRLSSLSADSDLEHLLSRR